ncbi:uncharacterized protein LOC109531001 [Hippocampus comes]|uniref:uncharacterized protein LOC109531001 n=1 Tax=Hippocampus comes TaxID=109280 RepID=UPI00094F1C09|nr:PREDICTED: uncharacterized protein LOC109531001 [Hippocampus comes]
MIKRWSATSFVALALLLCYTGTKVDAWTPPSGFLPNLPDPTYIRPYHPHHPPNPNPYPKPSLPKPPAHNKPFHSGPPHLLDHVSPPYAPVGSNFPFATPNVHPWPFLPLPSSQNPPAPQKPPSGDPHNPLGSGPYVFLKPPYEPLPPNPKPPSWTYSSSSQDSGENPSDHLGQPPWFSPPNPVPYKPTVPPSGDPHNPLGSGPYVFLKPPYEPLPPNPKPPSWAYSSSSQDPGEKPSDQLGKPPWFNPPNPVLYNPTVPVYSPFNPPVPEPPNVKPPNDQIRRPLLYYDYLQYFPNPSLPRVPVVPSYHVPSGPSKPHNPNRSSPPEQPQKTPSLSKPSFPSSPPINRGPKYQDAKQKNALPRGYSDQDYFRDPQLQQPGKQTPVPYDPRVKDPNLQDCDVTGVQRIRCGSLDISAAECEAISCCHDGQNCYFGKSVTVQCTKDAQFILVVARDATLPNIDINTISLLANGPGCTQIDSNSAFSIYQFPVSACGSVIMEDAGKIIYENRMTSSYEISVGPLGAITRDSSYELLFQCRYTATSVETLIAEMLPYQRPRFSVSALGPINVQLRLGNGLCLIKGCNEAEVAFNSFYTDADFPVSKVLRDNVYVEVKLMDRTDPNLVLTLGRCWTTTSANPHSMPQWDLLINGCPNLDDRYTAIQVPVHPGPGVDFPSHHRRFIFKMLTFVEINTLQPQSEHLYIHCSTSLCNAAFGPSCEPICSRRKRDVKSVAEMNEQTRIVVSAGPLVMIKP